MSRPITPHPVNPARPRPLPPPRPNPPTPRPQPRPGRVKRHALTFVLWSLIVMVTAIVSLTLGLGAMGGAHRVAYAMHAPAATVPAGNHVGILSAALYVVLAVAFVVMTTAVAWVTPRRRRSGASARTSPAGGRAGHIPPSPTWRSA